MRGPLRYLLTSLLVGMLSVGLAWAGSGLVPVPKTELVGASDKATTPVDPGEEGSTESQTAQPGAVPDPGTVLAGAHKVSIVPDQETYNGTWEQDRETCRTLKDDGLPDLTHAAVAGSPWPENPNCLYMGGYGIGPMNPITSVDDTGLWVRSAAVKGSNGKTLVTTIIDAEGYFWDYASKCTEAVGPYCGIKQITQQLGTELADHGVSPEGIVIASTHSHTSPDLIGGWGFVPDWYMKQVGEAIRTSITEAVTNMETAVLETGEEIARPFNGERRDSYRSAEEQQLTWLRALSTEGNSGQPNNGDPDTIFTIGAYAAHPVTRDEGEGVGHADWPVHFERTVEERFGGVGLLFMTGLGNISPRHPHPEHESEGGEFMGRDLAELIPERGTQLQDTRVAIARTTWAQPATNVPLTALGTPGFFDRKFLAQPATLHTGENPGTAPCISASPASVEVAVSAARIGNGFALTAAPGEIFSNFSNTVKEKTGAFVTMPIGQANDALGYMPQEFEMSVVGQQGPGFATSGVGSGSIAVIEYEDAYSIDRCFGEAALETTLQLLGGLSF